MPKLLTQGVSLEPKNGRQLIGIVAGFSSESASKNLVRAVCHPDWRAIFPAVSTSSVRQFDVASALNHLDESLYRNCLMEISVA